MQELKAVMRLDWTEVCRSRWLYFFLGLNVVLAIAFVGLGMRESAVLGFTGMTRVMFSIAHILLLLLPLLALMVTGQTITRGRDDGSLELLFSHPLPRERYFAAVSAVRYGALLLPFLGLMAVLAVAAWLAFGESVSWMALWRETVLCTVLLWSFTGIGLLVSVCVRNQAKALIYLILIWLTAVVLLDFGLIGIMLEWGLSAPGVFALAALNPVEAARVALLSSMEPTLANLGPAGFYLFNTFGPGWLFAMGLLWPLAIGCGAWLYARFQFLTQDLI